MSFKGQTISRHLTDLVFNKGQRSNTDVIHKDRSQGLLIIKYSTYKTTMSTVFETQSLTVIMCEICKIHINLCATQEKRLAPIKI